MTPEKLSELLFFPKVTDYPDMRSAVCLLPFYAAIFPLIPHSCYQGTAQYVKINLSPRYTNKPNSGKFFYCFLVVMGRGGEYGDSRV